MAPAAPHLLTLPRELRDIVYTYLSHTVDLTWPWKVPNEEVTVSLKNAPISSVLLVNSQMRDEYLEAPCFRHLSAVTDADPFNLTLNTFEEIPGARELLQAAFNHLQYAALFFHYRERNNRIEWIDPDPWTNVLSFIDRFTAMTPNLTIMKVAIQRQHIRNWFTFNLVGWLSHRDLLHGVEPHPALTRKGFMARPPASLASLPLVQRVEGYRLSHSISIDTEKAQSIPLVFPHIIPNRSMVPLHNIVKVGAYLYGRGQVDTHYWSPEEVGEHWALRFSQKNLEPQSEEEVKILCRLPYQVREWKDRRGDELMMAPWDEAETEDDVPLA